MQQIIKLDEVEQQRRRAFIDAVAEFITSDLGSRSVKLPMGQDVSSDGVYRVRHQGASCAGYYRVVLMIYLEVLFGLLRIAGSLAACGGVGFLCWKLGTHFDRCGRRNRRGR